MRTERLFRLIDGAKGAAQFTGVVIDRIVQDGVLQGSGRVLYISGLQERLNAGGAVVFGDLEAIRKMPKGYQEIARQVIKSNGQSHYYPVKASKIASFLTRF